MDFRTLEQRNELPSSHPQVGTYLTSGFQMACPHWHPHYELTIIHNPISYEIMNNSNTIRGNRPVISIHRPYTVHMVRTGDGEYLRSIVRFDSQFISGFPAGIVDLSKIAESDFACAYPDDDELEEFIDMTRKITSFLKEKKRHRVGKAPRRRASASDHPDNRFGTRRAFFGRNHLYSGNPPDNRRKSLRADDNRRALRKIRYRRVKILRRLQEPHRKNLQKIPHRPAHDPRPRADPLGFEHNKRLALNGLFERSAFHQGLP